MAAKKNPLKRIRLVYRRSSPLVKCIVLTALVLSTAALLLLRGAIVQARKAEDAMRQQAAVLEQENSAITQDIAELGTVQSVKELAGRFLGLVDPKTVIFVPEQ